MQRAIENVGDDPAGRSVGLILFGRRIRDIEKRKERKRAPLIYDISPTNKLDKNTVLGEARTDGISEASRPRSKRERESPSLANYPSYTSSRSFRARIEKSRQEFRSRSARSARLNEQIAAA